MPPGSYKIKAKSYLTDADQHCETLSAKTATLSIQSTCRVESCIVVAAATYMPAGLVLLPQKPLLFKHAYWLSAAAILMFAGLWLLNKHVCRPFTTQYCHSYCWYGVSLSAVPAGVGSYYRPCILVWCLTVGHAFWCSASL